MTDATRSPELFFLKPTECASLLRISVRTLQRLHDRGTAPPHSRKAGRLRYERDAVLAWMRQR